MEEGVQAVPLVPLLCSRWAFAAGGSKVLAAVGGVISVWDV